MFSSMLSISDSSAACPSLKMERNKCEERGGRYFSNAYTNAANTNKHINVKN